MDANGTRFHLFLSREDWARCSLEISQDNARLLGDIWDSSPPHHEGLIWDKEQGELTLEPQLFNFPPNGSAPIVENRRGAARDRFGNWYWIDETSLRIRVSSSGSSEVTDFWRLTEKCLCPDIARPGDFQPSEPPPLLTESKLSGLAVTENHYLVAGLVDPGGLLIFDLYSGGEPRQLFWPAGVDFHPYDMAARPGGGVWILDRDKDNHNHSYWALDRNFNVIGADAAATPLASASVDDFQPVDGSLVRQTAALTFPGSFSLLQSPPVLNPIAIEALPDGTVLILDYAENQNFSKIYRYRYGEKLPDDISTSAILDLVDRDNQETFKLIGYDIAFVPEHFDQGRRVTDRLYVIGADGNQTYAFSLCVREGAIELQPVPEYFPMRLFGGKALVGTDTAAYYDFGEKWIPLVHQRRPRYVDEATLLTPLTQPLDGRDPDCVWHRLMLDARIPPETKIEVWSRAANREDDLPLQQWRLEPAPYLRSDGSEIPFLRARNAGNGSRSACVTLGDGTWELLFQRARGRYLQLRVRLSGDERATPRLRAMRAYYPRFSYLSNYLPSVYREDEHSASFLDRFLANLEGLHTTLEDKLASAQVLFDVRSAPHEALDWLASWFDVALDPSWDEAKRRIFICHAMEFFQYRGTRRGLMMALHLALDPDADETIFSAPVACRQREQIRIIEKYLTRKIPAVALGDPAEATGLRSVSPGASWQPPEGGSVLSQRYAGFMDPAATSAMDYPLIAPTAAAQAEKWADFSQTTLGFVPSIYAREQEYWQTFLLARHGAVSLLNTSHQTSYANFAAVTLPRDLPRAAKAQTDWVDFVTGTNTGIERWLWQDFLARRYRRIRTLNETYGTTWTSFEIVALPDYQPNDGAPLNDWFQFETVVLRMQRTAHRFTVLLPMPPSLAFNTEDHQRRLDLSRRIVELEKPAHTVFDVRFYWDMFRVGEARLQLDTIIDQGSRAPQLLPKLVLGQGFVGESYLAPTALEEASDRFLPGRDPLARTPS
jgi:phage tail-like protein